MASLLKSDEPMLGLFDAPRSTSARGWGFQVSEAWLLEVSFCQAVSQGCSFAWIFFLTNSMLSWLWTTPGWMKSAWAERVRLRPRLMVMAEMRNVSFLLSVDIFDRCMVLWM